MRAFTVNWAETDVTKINYSESFDLSYGILKLDILQDAIAMLEQRYNEEHAKTFNDKKNKQ